MDHSESDFRIDFRSNERLPRTELTREPRGDLLRAVGPRRWVDLISIFCRVSRLGVVNPFGLICD